MTAALQPLAALGSRSAGKEWAARLFKAGRDPFQFCIPSASAQISGHLRRRRSVALAESPQIGIAVRALPSKGRRLLNNDRLGPIGRSSVCGSCGDLLAAVRMSGRLSRVLEAVTPADPALPIAAKGAIIFVRSRTQPVLQAVEILAQGLGTPGRLREEVLTDACVIATCDWVPQRHPIAPVMALSRSSRQFH